MHKYALVVAALSILVSLAACRSAAQPRDGITMLIDTSPTNLDPRIGTDGSSEHIDSLIFDALVRKDEHYGIGPG